MGLKTETREIGGRKFAVTQLGTAEGLRVFFKLGKLVGPSLGTLIKQWQGKSIEPRVFAGAVTELLDKLAWDDLQELVTLCSKSTHELVDFTDQKTGVTEERRVPLDKTIATVAFAGDYLSLLQWLGFCLELNFASFFVGLGLTKPLSSAEAE